MHEINQYLEIEFAGHQLLLLHQRALYLGDLKTLIIGDLHLGKIEHFRSSGIGMPARAAMHTFSQLTDLISDISPEKVLFLGDLFHSVKNHSFVLFYNLLNEFPDVSFTLVSGNHDILTESDYASLRMSVVEELIMGNLWFTHIPSTMPKKSMVNISGHIHPGVRLRGKAKQSVLLPCFFISESSMILPAFGYFTGHSIVKPTHKSRIFAIADKEVFEVPF